MNNGKYSVLLSYVDMLFAMLAAVFVLFIMSFLLINTKKDQHKVDPKAEIQVIMSWPDHSAHDIDLWILTPEHDAIGYRKRENGYVFLDHDDLGQQNDVVMVDGNPRVLYINQEVVSIRQRRPGRYVVNVEFYARHSDTLTNEVDRNPVPVTVQLTDLDPNYRPVYSRVVTLNEPNNEATAFQFDIEPDGSIDNITTDFHPFVFIDSSPPPGQTTDF